MIVLSYEEKMKLAFAIRVTQNYMGWGSPDKHGFETLHEKIGPHLHEGQEIVFRAPYDFERPCEHTPPHFLIGRRAVIVKFDPTQSSEMLVRLTSPPKQEHPTDGEERTVPICWIRPMDISDMSLDEIYDLEQKHTCTVGTKR